mmetsp:Transcript_86142/g.240904  ORF Transcript_86142/g.240904 Transcript_86142/m.240904 type:complete len:240 (+) Transcript_86142:1110-1829(+)
MMWNCLQALATALGSRHKPCDKKMSTTLGNFTVYFGIITLESRPISFKGNASTIAVIIMQRNHCFFITPKQNLIEDLKVHGFFPSPFSCLGEQDESHITRDSSDGRAGRPGTSIPATFGSSVHVPSIPSVPSMSISIWEASRGSWAPCLSEPSAPRVSEMASTSTLTCPLQAISSAPRISHVASGSKATSTLRAPPSMSLGTREQGNEAGMSETGTGGRHADAAILLTQDRTKAARAPS